MKAEILAALRGKKEYVSGQELCDALGVSRTAVWKSIGQLREEGYLIDAVPNKGYRLLEAPDLLNENELSCRLQTQWAGRELHCFSETGSTNIDAKQLAENGAPHGTLVTADTQTNGRGRRGHSWQSPAGTTIAMSLVLRPAFSPDKASMLTLVMGLAVAEAIEEVTGLATQIKWPNDTVVNHKKVTGILTEMSAEPDFIQYVIIGTGINVNSDPSTFPEEIRDMATSLKQECGHMISRADLVAAAMAHFEEDYERFCLTCDLSMLKESYEKRLANRDAEVKVLDPAGAYPGIARGIDLYGDLLVETADGSIKKINAGEVSVRGLYGYV